MLQKAKSEEELLTTIADLWQEVSSLRARARRHRHQEEETRRTSEYLNSIIETSLDCICVSDATGHITRVNRSFLDLLGYEEEEVTGKRIAELSVFEPRTYESVTGERVRIGDQFFEEVEVMINKLLEDGRVTNWESYYVRKDGKLVPVEHNIVNLYDSEKNLIGNVGILRDISQRKTHEAFLQRAHRELQKQVRERTASLEEANTTLKILLRKMDGEKRSVEAKIVSNVNALVMPYLKRIRNSALDEHQRSQLEAVEMNLQDIVSPLLPRLSLKDSKLTPVEIQVANFIKHGKTCKEIAQAMNLSSKTIQTHRKHIRAKLGIQNKKLNLRTYLLSLEEDLNPTLCADTSLGKDTPTLFAGFQIGTAESSSPGL